MSDARTTETSKLDDFLQKLKKVVRIVLYGPAISQLDCKKTGPYQLPHNNEGKLSNVNLCDKLSLVRIDQNPIWEKQ